MNTKLRSSLVVLLAAQTKKNEAKRAFNDLKVSDEGWRSARDSFRAGDDAFENAAVAVIEELQRLRQSEDLADALTDLGNDNVTHLRRFLSERGMVALIEEKALDLTESLVRIRRWSKVLTAATRINEWRGRFAAETFVAEVEFECPANVEEEAWERAISLLRDTIARVTAESNGASAEEILREAAWSLIEKSRRSLDKLTDEVVRMITPYVQAGTFSEILTDLDLEIMPVARELAHRVPQPKTQTQTRTQEKSSTGNR